MSFFLYTISLFFLSLSGHIREISAQQRIFGGSDVDFSRYPYFALIRGTYYQGNRRKVINCGGTLISKTVILTAAHCLDSKVTRIQVLLNIFDMDHDGNGETVERFDAVDWERHEDFTIQSNSVANDIGLIYLGDQPNAVAPIEIDLDGRPDTGDDVTIMGFGTTEDVEFATNMRDVTIDVISVEECKMAFSFVEDDSHFCTYEDLSGKGACSGDSGGPAIITEELTDIQVGIISFGAAQCSIGLSAFTRVSGYATWIKERVCILELSPHWCNSPDREELFTEEFTAGCFSGSSIVQVKGVGQVHMKDLNIGDMVHVGNNIYEQIYSFGHRAHAGRANMMQISTETSRLRLTPDHMVFTQNKGAVQASQIKVGDILLGGDGESTLTTVMSVHNVTGYGLFNPFTPSGIIVVDKILSSNYIAFEDNSSWQIGGLSLNYHWLAHAAVAPLRIACYHFGSCEQETYAADGVLECLKIPLNFVQWVFAQNGINHVISFLLISLILVMQYAIEKLILNPLATFVLLCIFCLPAKIFWLSHLSASGLNTFATKVSSKIKKFEKAHRRSS